MANENKNKNNQTINVVAHFKSKGIDEIKKDIQSFKTPLLLLEDKEIQKQRSSLERKASRIQNEFKKGTINEEQRNKRTAALAVETEAFTIKAAKALIEGMGTAADGFKQDVLAAIKEVEASQKTLDEIRAEKAPFDEKFKIDTEESTRSIEPRNLKIEEELANEGLRILEQTLEGKQKLQEAGIKEGQKAGEILNLRKEIRKEYGEGADEAIEQAIKEGKVNEKLSAILKKKDNERLTEKQKIARLAVLEQAKEEAGKEKILEYAKLEKKETDAIGQLQHDLNILYEERKKLLDAIDASELSEKEKEQYKETVKALDPVIQKTEKLLKLEIEAEEQKKETIKSNKDFNRVLQGQGSTLGKAASQVFNYGIAFTALRRIYRETLRTIKDLDKALTEMAIVTTMNRSETWKLTGQMSALARETGFTISEISKLSTIYFRQGRVLSEVIELTRVAAMAARIAGISAAESADFLTSAVNAFQFSADQALAVSDRFAALAASSASSYQELAVGLSKFAAQANVAGVSIDFAMGLLAKGIETTREAPETIGTALKTVIARMRELTDLGKTFEDGMDISRVDNALRQVGITLRDEQGQFRDMELVLTELGQKFDTLTTNQRASVAVALAGTRQQSRLIAIMSDFDRTLQLVNVSQDSAGATAAQHIQFMQGLEGATIRMQAAYQDFITTISNSDMLIGIVDLLTRTIDNLSKGISLISNNSKFWMSTLILVFAALKILTFGTKAYNKAIALKTVLTNMENAGMKLNWLNTKRLILVKNIEKAQTLLQNKLLIKKNLLIHLENGLRAKGIILLKLQIFLMKVLAAVMSVNPFILAVVAIAGLVLAFGALTSVVEKNTEKYKENTKALQAANYESTRTVKSIQQITKQMEKFNNMSYLTPEQQEELETLNSQLSELYGEENQGSMAGRLIDGSINVELQIRLNQLAVEKEINAIHERRQELAESLLRTTNQQYMMAQEAEEFIVPLWGHILSGGIMSAVQGAVHFAGKAKVANTEFTLDPNELDLQSINEYGDIFIQELDRLFENELTPEADLIFRKFLENTYDFSKLDVNAMSSDLSSFVEATFGDTAQVFQDFSNQVSKDSPLGDRFRNFLSFMSQPDLDLNLEQLLRTQIQPGLNFLDSISDGDVKGLISTLETLNLTSDNQIQQLGSIFGEDLRDVIDLVAAETTRLSEQEGFTVPQAQEIAWSTLIGTIDDSTKAIQLNNIIFTQSTSDMANSLDHLNSRLKRSMDVQKQWLEGTLGFAELSRFFDENPNFFNSMEDVNRFLSGEAISDSVFVEQLREEEMALSRIFDAQRRLSQLDEQTSRDGITDSSRAAKSAILAEIAAYKALTQFTGPLSQTTEAQTRFNAEFARYNRLSEVGIATTEDFNRLLQAQSVLFEESTQAIEGNLENIDERFARMATSLGFSSTQFSDFFTVVGGKIIPAQEELEGLGAASMRFFYELIEEYQENLDQAFDLFMERRNMELDNEKKLLDQQKKVYEDYFSALDRLENQRERKRSREDLVSQLQRLEGATDERSRARALELRRELNQTDEQESKTMIQEARQSLLKAFDTAYEELEATWGRMTQEFMDTLDNRSSSAGEGIADGFEEGVENGNASVPVETTGLDTSINNLNSTLTNFVQNLNSLFEGQTRQQFLNQRTSEILSEGGTLGEGNMELAEELARQQAEAEAKTKFGFAKGGMVDFEGLAMLHGSKSSPEAVLNPMQTEMFMGLRDALEKVSFNPNGSTGSVKIENISISTGSMNSNQDFKRAGETLAEAFRGAIQRKGITLNTNKV